MTERDEVRLLNYIKTRRRGGEKSDGTVSCEWVAKERCYKNILRIILNDAVEEYCLLSTNIAATKKLLKKTLKVYRL